MTENILLKRTNSGDTDFITLIKELDADLEIRYGKQQSFYNQFNKVDMIKNVIVAYFNNIPVGCGAFKEFDKETVEIKRMFVAAELRGKKIGMEILHELESWAKEINYNYAVLETGKSQPEAIKLYNNNKYEIIPNYGQYEGIDNSICMKKTIS